MEALTDPWAPATPRATARAPGRSAWVQRWVAAALLGTAGPAVALWMIPRKRHAVALVAAGLAWEAIAVLATRAWRHGLAPALGLGLAVATLAPVTIGPAAVTAVVSIALAHVVFAGWGSPTPLDRPPDVAALVMFPLVAAQISLLRRDEAATVLVVRPVTVGLLAVAALALVLQRSAPGAAAGAERRLAVVVSRVAAGLGSAVLLILAVPLLYLPGAVSRLVVRTAHPRRRAVDGRPGWVPRSSGLREVRRDARRPFVTTEPRDRRRRVLVGLACVVVLAATVAVVVRRDRSGWDGPLALAAAANLRYSELPALADAPWADDLQDEQATYATDGRYLSVVDGVRRSEPMPSCACRKVTVWLFGGSAAFGLAQRDLETIASHLVRAAVADDIAIDMTNLASPGFTIWDDFEKFAGRLALTEDRPDLVIFYDGFNDVVGTVLHTALKGLDRQTPTVLDLDETFDYSEDLPSLEPFGGPASVGRFAIEKYLGVKEQIEALASAQGVRTVFVLQSDAFTSRRRLADFADHFGATPEQFADADVGKALAAAPSALPDDVINLRTVLADVDEPVFISPVHHNEEGAAIVAAAMLRELEPTLRQVAR